MRVQKTIGWLLALTPLLALFSCESDDTMPDSQQGERVPVTIRLGVEGSGLATRSDNTAEVIENDDAITSLDVYIMNGSTVEEHLTLDAFGDDHIAENITLTAGNKHIYAVANYSGLTGIPSSNQTVDALSKITSENGIPMSADTTWNVDATGTYEVELVRMVAQMQVSIVDDRNSTGTETFTSLTINDLLPTTTMLYRNSRTNTNQPSITLPSGVEMKDWTWSSPQTSETNAKTFYLHETTSTDGFEIELKTSDDDADPRTASIPLSIPRNFIQPLVIHITDYSLDITIKTQVAPIGVYPAEVTQNGYEIKLPEGCTFDVTVTAKKNMTPSTWESGASWSWSVTENTFTNTELVFNNDAPSNTGTELTNTNNSFTFSGTVTSMPLKTKSCTITVVLRDGEAEQTFPIVITVRELGDTEWTRSTSSEASPIIIEL